MACRTPNHDPNRLDAALLPATAIEVCTLLNQAEGTAYLVGGCVRDMAMGMAPKDIDIEVYGIEEEHLQTLLNQHGRVELVGKQFGVFKFWYHHHEIDIALPRTEIKTEQGHRGFEVTPDPFIEPEIASLRRDFTINAMMYDPLNKRLLDFHHGIDHLRKGTLRHVSPAFAEDPLRVLRAMQFAARFKLELDMETAVLCRSLLSEADSLPSSRIWTEWQKWCHAPYPSYGLKVLQQSGWIKLYPELEAIIDCPQDPKWHPEGDVWIHTLQVVDQAVIIADRYGWHGELREYLLLSSLCHDLGKAVCTFTDNNGVIRSPGHSHEGVADSIRFLKKIAAPKRISQYVLPLVHEHMTHMHGDATPRAVRNLAVRLEAASIELWEALVEADASGRAPSPPSRPALEWLEKAKQMHHHLEKPEPIITGKTLMTAGIKSGPEMGKLLARAYQAQLDGEFDDAAAAEVWLTGQITA
jgi:tRNA nucleotidyltransferase (CCA-adding enzyme)